MSTIRRLLNQLGKVDVEALMTSDRFWRHFLRCLVVLERKAGRV